MKMHRVRFTVRRMMIAVAVVGIISGVFMRAVRFRELSVYHRSKIILVAPPSPLFESTLYHMELANKYQHAARRPWLPVDPDPPEPEEGEKLAWPQPASR